MSKNISKILADCDIYVPRPPGKWTTMCVTYMTEICFAA
jgi:hypothetical protein